MEQIYTYDGNRNLKTIRAQYSPWYDQVFAYDALSRLKHVTNVHGDFDYTYDKVGNRLTRTENGQVSTYEYIAGTNRIDNISGPDGLVSYSYDAGGNITGIGNRTLVYNQSNRLMRVEQGGSPLGEYTYNGLGQRVIKKVGGATTIFQYDFDGNIIAESATSGKFTYEYLYAGAARIAMVDVLAGKIYSFLNNFNGTPIILTDQDGMVIWEADYKPFGEELVNSNSEVVNNFRYAGQYFDQETGLHYNYFRYYDPATGRYLTPDPIGLTGGVNLFSYAGNNPINFIDPLGLIGIGGDFGGSINFFGFRFSLDLEVRMFHDSTRSWNDLSSYSFAITLTESHILPTDLPDAFVAGAEVDIGTSILINNANRVEEICGFSETIFGSSGGWGQYGYNVELTEMTDYRGNPLLRSDGVPIREVSYGQYPMPGRNYGFEVHTGNRNRTIILLP